MLYVTFQLLILHANKLKLPGTMLTELLQGIEAGGFLLIQGTVSKIYLVSSYELPRSGLFGSSETKQDRSHVSVTCFGRLC